MPSTKQFFNSLKQFFNISSKKIQGFNEPVPFPGSEEKNQKNLNLKPANFNDELLSLYKYFLSDTYETSDSLKNRMDRYKSLKYAYYNSPIISMTIDLYADEATQIDSQSKIIEVEARDKKVQKFIQDFFSSINLTQKIIRDAAWTVSLFGDAFWIITSSVQNGITEIVPIDPESVKERLEFNAIEAQKKLNKNKGALNTLVSRNTNLKAIQNMVNENTDDFSQHFKNYLFGFQVEKMMLPPWNVLHFRSFTTQSEFYPFGRPVLINSLAPFRQLQAVKNLMALGRANSFTIKVFKVLTDENATPEDKWEAVNQAKQQWQNLSNNPSGKEEFTVNSEVWIPDGLIETDEIESRFDPDKVDDVEMLRDDLIMGTRVPKGYLIVDRASFGTSGQALLAQHKPFARAVYSIQSTMLEQLSQLVKMQMIMTGAFDPDEAEFQLKMAFPQVEESSDRVRAKSDLLRLAKDVIDDLGGALGLDRDEALPPEVVKQILNQLSFLDGEDINDWVDATVAEKEKNKQDSGDGGGLFASRNKDQHQKIQEWFGMFNKKEIKEGRLNQIRERLQENPQIINECYFRSCKKFGLNEGIMNNKHFYFSYESDGINKQLLDALQYSDKENNQLNE